LPFLARRRAATGRWRHAVDDHAFAADVGQVDEHQASQSQRSSSSLETSGPRKAFTAWRSTGAPAGALALLHIMLIFRLQPRGFTNADLRALLADYLGGPPGTITPGQATYDLRRLKEHGFIRRIPHSHRYHVTDIGLAQAMFLARAHDRLLLTGWPNSPRQLPAARSARPHAPTRQPSMT
jgi:hypothetical protein